MLLDYHVHTFMCGHAGGTMESLVGSALALGLDELGIADHMPMLFTDDPELAMSVEELPLYVERVLDLKDRYAGRIEVRLGIEADYEPETMEERADLLESYPWDYVIGSVHSVDGWMFDDPRLVERYEGLDINAFYVRYLELVSQMAATGLYDVVGHPDLVKKFDRRAGIDLRGYYRGLLERVLESGMCYEVNTSGLRWPASEIYPEPAFVELAAAMGVPVTLGSDAHRPGDVGRDFDQALSLIRGAGYSEVATYEARRMSLQPLD